MQLILAILLLLSGSALAQQDNSVQSSMTFNLLAPGAWNIADRFGNKITITILPDTDGPVKVDAMLSCQATIVEVNKVFALLITRYLSDANSVAWRDPMKATQVKLDATKAKLDALFQP